MPRLTPWSWKAWPFWVTFFPATRALIAVTYSRMVSITGSVRERVQPSAFWSVNGTGPYAQDEVAAGERADRACTHRQAEGRSQSYGGD